MKLSVAVIGATIAFTMPAVAAEYEGPTTMPIQRLVMDLAVKMANASIDECRKQGVNVAAQCLVKCCCEGSLLRLLF